MDKVSKAVLRITILAGVNRYSVDKKARPGACLRLINKLMRF